MPVVVCPLPAELQAYWSGMLSGMPQLRVAEHVVTCRDCQRRLAVMQPPAEHAMAPTQAEVRVDHSDTEPDLPGIPPDLGPYHLVKILGRGGMGIVYEAVHVELGSRAAVKVLAQHCSDADAVRRFRKEWQAIGRLDHPNVVRALHAGIAGTTPYLAMELVSGPDAGTLVRRLGRLNPAEATAIIIQAAEGLAHAHAAGIIHRDVKPSNLVLAPDGTVKLLDLGLACISGSGITSTRLTRNIYLGTADYMAPEQWDDSAHVGPAADVYALGCVYYQLLTGAAPYAAPDYPSPRSKMLAHQESPVPDPRQVCPDLPSELVLILQAMLAKDPQARPMARTLAPMLAPLAAPDRLGRLAEMASTPDIHFNDGPPTARIELPPQRWPRGRSRWVLGIFAGIAFAGAVGAGLYATQPWNTEPFPPGAAPEPPRADQVLHAPLPGNLAPDTRTHAFSAVNASDTQPVALATLPRLEHPPVALAFLPDGQHILTGELDGTIRRWDLASREASLVFDPHNAGLQWHLKGMLLDPRGTTLIAYSTSKLTILDMESGRVRLSLDMPRPIHSVAISGDGATLAVGHDNALSPESGHPQRSVSMYHLATGKLHAAWNDPQPSQYHVMLGMDDRIVFVANQTGQTARLTLRKLGKPIDWNTTASPMELVNLAPVIGSRAVLMGEQKVAVGRMLVARLYRIGPGEMIREQAGVLHTDWVLSCASASADARRAAAGTTSGDFILGGVATDPPSRGPWHAHEGPLGSVALNAEGTHLLTAGVKDHLVRWWQLPTTPTKTDTTD